MHAPPPPGAAAPATRSPARRLGRPLVAAVTPVLALSLAASLAAAPAGAAGNGLGSKSALQIVKAAGAALKRATSFTLSGSFTQGGDRLAVDTVAGTSSGYGSMDYEGFPIKLIAAGGSVYVKGPAGFWKKGGVPAADIAALTNVWVDGGSQSFASLGEFLSVSEVDASFSTSGTTFTKRGTTKLHGQEVYVIGAKHGKSDEGTFYVAATGQPYVVEEALTAGSGGVGSLYLSNFNKPVHVKAPTHSVSLPS